MSNPTICLTTNLGAIVLQLDPSKAELTCKNFLLYVNDGHYDNTIFHRVIKGFMIQGGGLSPTLVAKPTQAPVQNEANNGLKNEKYTIAMARTSAPHSATSQFFINVHDNDFLNHSTPTASGWGYCVFGKVIEGFDVVDLIANVKTHSQGVHDDVPVEAVTILSATTS